MKKDAFYYLRFNGCLYLVQYKCNTILGHCFKSGNDTIYAGETRLTAENPVLWKVKK